MSLEKKTIFIHIPKTGGTSINCDMHQTEWQTQPDFYYRHLIYTSKKSNSGDIFDPKQLETFRAYNIFMMLRDPIDRLFSEYYFLKDRPEFFSLLSKKPKNFYEYCLLNNTQNSIIKFLIGERIYSNRPIKESDWSRVLDAVEELPILMGVFEEYENSLSYLNHFLEIPWSEEIEKKRITIHKPKQVELTDEQKIEVQSVNQYDYQLYHLAVQKLTDAEYDELDLKIIGTKYDYVLKFTERFVLIEPMIEDKFFIKNNRDYFNYLNKKIRLMAKTGFEYVNLWNIQFVVDFNRVFIPSKIVVNTEEEPLEFTNQIAKFINSKSSHVTFKSKRLTFVE